MRRGCRDAVGVALLVLLAGVILIGQTSGAGTVVAAGPALIGRAGTPLANPLSLSVNVPPLDVAVSVATPTTAARTLVRTVARQVAPGPVATTSVPSVQPPVAPTSTTSTSTPSSTSTTTGSRTTLAVAPAPTTTTTVAACRNSTSPSCGLFRFDPQPGADSPMTVQVVVEPVSAKAGQPMVFHVSLVDADGVSYGSSLYGFGDSGIGDSSQNECKKFGPWAPPLRDPAHATVTEDIRHTYFEAGTYTASFAFDAGPFDCVDSVTGWGDRPYASSATGTVTVVVVP